MGTNFKMIYALLNFEFAIDNTIKRKSAFDIKRQRTQDE